MNQRPTSPGHRDQYPITRGRITEIRLYPDVSCGGRERTCSGRVDFAASMYRMAASHRRRGLREARPLYGCSILYLPLLFAGLAVRIVLCFGLWAAGP